MLSLDHLFVAARRLRGVVPQISFDLVTPQVSFAAHASGLFAGFLLMAFLAASTATKV